MTLKEKCQSYARSYHFSFTPEEWGYEELSDHLRRQEGTFEDMANEMNLDELCPWEPFEDYNPSWVADQMDMMTSQLEELFK